MSKIYFTKTNSILDKICKNKVDEILHGIKFPKRQTTIRNFSKSISGKKLNVIAELKHASPTEGTLRNDLDLVRISQIYEECGASALSYVTDKNFFQGNIDNISIIRHSSSLPLIRKDFIIHESQIQQSYGYEADAILLIVSILDDFQLRDFFDIAVSYKLDVLFEIHDKYELERTIKLNPLNIGVNNRSLKDFSVNLDTFINLSNLIPKNITKVTESGIKTNTDVKKLVKAGADAALIGTTLLKSANIQTTYKELFE